MTKVDLTKLNARIVAYVQRHPELTYDEICAKLHLGKTALTTAVKEAGYVRRLKPTSTINFAELER